MVPFSAGDSQYFYGREAEIHQMVQHLRQQRFLLVIGPSGSGKSSLTFDTIYAEGQRRYVESLSAYARQFLEQMAKPDVDSIDGLSPAIAIEHVNVLPMTAEPFSIVNGAR